jgi:hypothetical protein
MKTRRSFAQGTDVSVAKSRTEIDTMLAKNGATSIGSLWGKDAALLVFEMKGRKIKLTLPLPEPSDPIFEKDGRGTRTDAQRASACDAEQRRRWRTLKLVIQSKMESVESGVETFDQCWLAHIMAPDGQTVGEAMIPQLVRAYRDGVSMPPLLGKGR